MHLIVKMSPASSVKNCLNNAKSLQIWIFMFFHLASNDVCTGCKQLVCHNSVFSFYTLFSTVVCKGSVFLQFCDKIQSIMHQIFNQMYLIVSIGQSHLERPMESFIKKFFFRSNGHPIFQHMNSVISQEKILPNKYMPIYHPAPILKHKSRRHMNPVVNN